MYHKQTKKERQSMMEIDLDKRLEREDVPEIVGRILDVQTKSEILGRVLRLKASTVAGIHKRYRDPEECLFHIIDEFVKQVNPVPTWRVILTALRHRTIRLNRLADQIEGKTSDETVTIPKTTFTSFLEFLKSWKVVFVSMLIVVIALTCFNTSCYQWLNMDRYQLEFSLSNRLPPVTDFVGREEDIHNITGYLDFTTSDVQVVHIVGPPGFGKSTLAMKIGHILVRNKINVHYVDLRMVKDVDDMAEKVMISIVEAVKKEVTFSRLEKWVRNQHSKTLIILDNCDEFIEHAKDEFLDSIEGLTHASSRKNVRYIITSQKWVANIGSNFRLHPIYNLSSEAAIELLSRVAPSLTDDQKIEIADLTGNVPLALTIVGAIFRYPDAPSADIIVKQLKENLVATLSRDEFNRGINISIGIAFSYLTPELKQLCLNLSLFPGSFDEESAVTILGCSRKMLYDLVKRSLLQSVWRTTYYVRFFFHGLLKTFFCQIQNDRELEYHFSSKFQLHYANILHYALPDNSSYMYPNILSDELHNFVYMFELITSHKHVANTYFAIKVISNEMRMIYLDAHSSTFKYLLMFNVLKNYTSDERASVDNFMETYVTVLIFSAKSTDSAKSAIKLLASYETAVHHLYKNKHLSFYTYSEFYTTLGDYYRNTGEMKKSAICHFHIIRGQHALDDCHPHCDYFSVSIAYEFVSRNTRQAHYFRKLAFEHQYASLVPINKTRLLLGLYYDYLNSSIGNDLDIAKDYESDLNETMFSILLGIHKTEYNENVFRMALEFYRMHLMEDKVDKLQKKMIECIVPCDCDARLKGGDYSGYYWSVYNMPNFNGPLAFCERTCALNYGKSALDAYHKKYYYLAIWFGEQSCVWGEKTGNIFSALIGFPSSIVGFSHYQLGNYSAARIWINLTLSYTNGFIMKNRFHTPSRQTRLDSCLLLLSIYTFDIKCFITIFVDMIYLTLYLSYFLMYIALAPYTIWSDIFRSTETETQFSTSTSVTYHKTSYYWSNLHAVITPSFEVANLTIILKALFIIVAILYYLIFISCCLCCICNAIRNLSSRTLLFSLFLMFFFLLCEMLL